jgi:heme O synthase-like polyprenyltransferase
MAKDDVRDAKAIARAGLWAVCASLIFVPLLWWISPHGTMYVPVLLGALLLDGGFLYYALKLKIAPSEDSPMATFRNSISYLMALFSFLLIDHYLPAVWPA